MNKHILSAVLLGLALSLNAAETGEKPKVDEKTGLIVDENWELVKIHCTACHSPRQITMQRGTRQMWLDMIRWMQRTQGLWKFKVDEENKILDYLAKNYAPAGSYRRMPIPPDLMPINPYTATPK